MTTLKTAPGLFPYSADAPSETTSISSITSVSGHGQAAPDTGAVKSTPSIRYLFSSTPEPKAETRLLVPLVGLVADMPGADFVKSKKLNRRSGVFSMYSFEKFVETPDLRVSTTGALAGYRHRLSDGSEPQRHGPFRRAANENLHALLNVGAEAGKLHREDVVPRRQVREPVLPGRVRYR